ncbi:MAG: class II fumarate hydratase, partial [Bacteroidales bacterium]|nr:class II fumarate hydratase [Bacteroidales bacterium]
MIKIRKESDSMGTVEVPETAYWGAQTQRSIMNFKIGNIPMPQEVIHMLAV